MVQPGKQILFGNDPILRNAVMYEICTKSAVPSFAGFI